MLDPSMQNTWRYDRSAQVKENGGEKGDSALRNDTSSSIQFVNGSCNAWQFELDSWFLFLTCVGFVFSDVTPCQVANR
jgi:hypothetical protein